MSARSTDHVRLAEFIDRVPGYSVRKGRHYVVKSEKTGRIVAVLSRSGRTWGLSRTIGDLRRAGAHDLADAVAAKFSR